MGNMIGSAMAAELQRRLTNLSDTHAYAALNEAQRWCLRQGSYQFMMAGPVTLSPVLTAAPGMVAATGNVLESVTPLDPSKAKMMFNTDGTPIQHLPWSDFWQSLNYNLPTSTAYDCYTIKSTNSAADVAHVFYFMPNISGTAYFYYHRIAGDIVANGYSELPSDFDHLLIDLAEAKERRIYDVGETWQLLMGQCQDQIKVLLDGYRSETQQATSLNDAQTKISEVTQVGRS